MKIELECCGFNPCLLKVTTDVITKIAIVKNRIIIESIDQQIGRFTIRSKSIYNNKLCYFNIINPIHYLYQYKLKNDDTYFYDDGFVWADVYIQNTFDCSIKIEKETKNINGSTVTKYTINKQECRRLRICYHNVPSNQIYRYKLTNIASQLFYSILIMSISIFLLINNSENILLYICALIFMFVISGIKIYKYKSSKSTKDI